MCRHTCLFFLKEIGDDSMIGFIHYIPKTQHMIQLVANYNPFVHLTHIRHRGSDFNGLKMFQ